MLGLLFCARAFSSCGKWGPLFIAVRRPLTIADSLVAEHRLQTRRTQLLRGMWDPPRPGLELVSPALAGRFSTTAPPGKPSVLLFIVIFLHICLFILPNYYDTRFRAIKARSCPHFYLRVCYVVGTRKQSPQACLPCCLTAALQLMALVRSLG